MIFTLNQSTLEAACGDVPEFDISREGAKERDTFPYEHRNTRDDESLNQAGAKKLLNGDAAINVNVSNAARFKLGDDFNRIARHMLHLSSRRGGHWRTSAKHKNGFGPVRPAVEPQDAFKRVAANHQRIYRGHELFVPVRFTPASGKEIVCAAASRDESIETGTNEN